MHGPQTLSQRKNRKREWSIELVSHIYIGVHKQTHAVIIQHKHMAADALDPSTIHRGVTLCAAEKKLFHALIQPIMTIMSQTNSWTYLV